MPMIAALAGLTKAAAGVIVARPATAPVSRPTNLGLRSIIHAIPSQVIAAKDAAMSVLMKARAVI
jgi:hypothetical protein